MGVVSEPLQPRHWWCVVLLFLLGWLVLYACLPRSGRFHYDFQRGKVWPYRTLYAPFTYPLYKSSQEIRYEREQLLKSAGSVFRLDESVADIVTEELVTQLRVDYTKYCDSLLKRNPRLSLSSELFTEVELLRFQEVVAHVYSLGVVRSETVLANAPSGRFSILRGSMLCDSWYDNVYTPRRASALLSQELLRTVKDVTYKQRFWSSISVASFFQENMTYDSTFTQNLQESVLSKLSLAKGTVVKGTVIVEQGSVVREAEFARLESLRKELALQGVDKTTNLWQEVGYALLLLIMLGAYLLFLEDYDRTILRHNRNLLFLLLLVIGAITTGFLVVRLAPSYLYMVPLAIVPLLIRSFFTPRLAFTTHVFTLAILALFIPDSYVFFLVTFMVGIVAIYGVKTIGRRSRLFESIGFIFLTYVVLYAVLQLIMEGKFNPFKERMYVHFAVNSFLCLSSYLLMYPLERVFGFISSTTLMELGDSNRRLLRELAERAPGTFQHVMQVANLAEAAVSHIGGNALLTRIGALYHDIGKMLNPELFTENQSEGETPHRHLTERQSAEVIIRHVTDGQMLAQRYRLPQAIINFIVTHHGTTRTEYFYRMHKQKYPEQGDHPEWFTYPGPKPFSREMVVLMMADSVEAASRSLKTITPETLRNLVEEIIAYQQNANQYDESDITLREIAQVKELFIHKLENIYHSRIEYPKDPDAVKKEASPQPEAAITGAEE